MAKRYRHEKTLDNGQTAWKAKSIDDFDARGGRMQFLLQLSSWIDRISRGLGWVAIGLTLVMTAVGAYNAITRYLGQYIGSNLSSNRYIEVQWYLFSLVFLLGAAYVLQKDAHVRVDIIYSRLSQKQKAWIDLLGALLMLIPFCLITIFYSIPAVKNSWSVWEQSSDPSGLPRYPLKTMIPIAFTWLAIQGFSEAIKQVAILQGLSPLSSAEGES